MPSTPHTSAIVPVVAPRTHLLAAAAAALATLLLLPTLVAAQPAGPSPVHATESARSAAFRGRSSGGISVLGAAPRGEFARDVDAAGGMAGHFLYALDPHGIVALRAEVALLNHGSERRRVSPNPAYGNLIRYDLTTTNNIGTYAGGLQLMSPRGPIRPYVAGLAGVSQFWTQSTVDGEDETENEGFGRTVNSSDAAFTWSGTGGVFIPLGAKRSWGLDLGATYQRTPDARYMHEGSVTDVNGVPTAGPATRGSADLVVYRVGVRFGT